MKWEALAILALMAVIIVYLLAGPVVNIKPIEQMQDDVERERLLDDPLAIPPFAPQRGIEDKWTRRLLIAFVLVFALKVAAQAAQTGSDRHKRKVSLHRKRPRSDNRSAHDNFSNRPVELLVPDP